MSSLPIFNGLTSSTSNNSTVTWVGNFDSNLAGSEYSGITTTSSTYPSQPKIDIKRCRMCNHAHLADQVGCIEQDGFNFIYVICPCKEYVPSDNLEYLEYLYKKKTDK